MRGGPPGTPKVPAPPTQAAVAPADEMARTLWAVMANGTAYRRPLQAA